MYSSNDLIGLSYCSTATFSFGRGDHGVNPEVNRILVYSRRNNRRREVGGVLHYGSGFFFQYLEGPADTVDCLYARICRDPRHERVERLTRRPIRNRRFRDWSMKFVAIESVVDEVMTRHGLDAFDPYRFTPAVIDDLVVSFIQVDECAPDIELPSTPAGSGRGWLARLFGRFNRS